MGPDQKKIICVSGGCDPAHSAAAPTAAPSAAAPTAAAPVAPVAPSPAGVVTSSGKGMGTRVLEAGKAAKDKVSQVLSSGMQSFKALGPKGKAGVVLGVIAVIGGAIWAMSDNEIVAEGEAELDSYNSIMQPVFDSEIGGFSYGGEISDIGEEGKTEVITALTAAVGSGDRASLSPEGIVGIIAGTSAAQSASGLSKEELETELKDNPEFKAVVETASSQLLAKVDAAAAAGSGGGTTPPGPGGSGSGGSGPLPPPISGGGSQGTGGNDGYDLASSILKEKGYLKEIQSDWTPEFDAAFREFVDAGTATGKVPTNLVGGQSWSDVAGSLGVSPNKSGAFSIINSLANVTPQKGSASSDPSASTQPTAPSETKPAATVSGGNSILADIIGAMNNEKLVGTPGFDLVKEPKRIQALVNAAGGANPAGYGGVAAILAQKNPSILAKLPKELTGPVDKTFAKDPANKELLQAIQVTINKIYNLAIPAIVKPNLEKSTELMSAWLATPEGGNWSKAASNSNDQWVKLASERKMRIRAKIAAEMTPAERAAARRLRMREAV